MSKQNLCVGESGEEVAVLFLKKSGYRVLARNYRTRLGEIDIVARDKETICFVEVKARRSERFGSPKEAVSRAKQLQIAKAALVFLKENKLLDRKARFDVVSVLRTGEIPKVELVKNAFELDGRFFY